MKEKCGTLLIAAQGEALAHNLDFWITEQGHRLKAVNNLKDLLMTLQSEKINVLVMDARLPEEMGYEAISIIKGLDRKLPIIICADENNPEQESRIRHQGIFYYHVNSFGLDDLILAISNAMVRSSQ
jgi:two-component system, OmpR family, phosphate regulon response regulator OmpR